MKEAKIELGRACGFALWGTVETVPYKAVGNVFYTPANFPHFFLCLWKTQSTTSTCRWAVPWVTG